MADSTTDFVASLQYAAKTDLGMRRANNQDSHTVVLAEDDASWRECGHVLMVADGMGAHAAGELASKIAVDGVPHLYQHYRDLSPAKALERAILETNAEIHRRGRANPDFHNMGTTASVLVLSSQGVLVGHVGDSRVYRLRGERFEQLTFDHSLVWELQAAGQLTPGTDLAKSVPKNVITRSLGPNSQVVVDVEGPLPIQAGDTFLLCSDGLSGQVQDHEMGAILACLPPAESASVLIDLANLRGGPDNVTVIVAKVVGGGLVTAAADAASSSRHNRIHLSFNLAAAIAAGVCCCLALFMWLAQLVAPACVFALAAVVALSIGTALSIRDQRLARGLRGTNLVRGKAPYRNTLCKPGGEFVATLATTVEQLQRAARESHWQVNWSTLEGHLKAARQATSARHYNEAVRSYAHAISFIMQELRQQQRREASDSSIQL